MNDSPDSRYNVPWRDDSYCPNRRLKTIRVAVYTCMCLHGDGSDPQMHFNEAPENHSLLNYAMTVLMISLAKRAAVENRKPKIRPHMN